MNATTAFTWLLTMPLVASAVIYLAGRIAVRSAGTAAPAPWLSALTLAASGVAAVRTSGRRC